MITRRITTRVPVEPPVRFYRTIALTFLILTVVLLGIVIFFTSKKATIVIAAKSDNKNINLLVEMGRRVDGGSAISGIVTSSVFKWSEKYYPTGNKETDGLAIGEVVIYNKSSEDQPLVQTTRLLTTTGVLFRLSNNEYIPANSSKIAKVYADIAGVSGDIGPSRFTIPGLSTERQKVVYAESVKKMSGGIKRVGILSGDDLLAAKNDYILKAKQAYLSLAPSLYANKSMAIELKNENIFSDRQVGAVINEFTLSGTSSVVVVYYDKIELQNMVSKEISKGIDIDSEKVLSVGGTPQIKLSSYDLINGAAKLSVYQDVLVTLDPNGSKLSPVNFFGQRKNDIERYVMGLGHVVGVDVKFSPSWMRTAPRVTDKIKVVVKQVK